MTEQIQQDAPIHVFVQGPDGEDYFTSEDLIDCWLSSKYGGLSKRVLVIKPDSTYDLFAVAVEGPTEYKKYTVNIDYGVLKVFGHDGTLHTAYAPGAWLQVQGKGLQHQV